MNRELEETIARVSRETGIPITQIASCPTADRFGISDGKGTVIFDEDDPGKRPLAVLLKEGTGEPVSVSQQP